MASRGDQVTLGGRGPLHSDRDAGDTALPRDAGDTALPGVPWTLAFHTSQKVSGSL